jgi:hypothetical protein
VTAISWPTSLSGRLELQARTAWLAAGTVSLILALGTLRVTGGSSDLVRVLQASLVVVYTILVWTDLRAAMAILMLEIVLGGASGHWTTVAGPISGRVLLEALLMLRVAVVLVWERSRLQLLGRYGLHALAVAFLIPAIWMALGVARGNTLSNVFGDGNGVALFSLAIAFELLLRDGWGAWIRGWFYVCCVANAVVTGALVLASRAGIVALTPTLSHILVDDLRVGNVVGYMPNGAYRLYLANSLFLPIVIAFASYKLLTRPRSPWLWALFALGWADVIETYTRGVWVTSAAVFVAVLALGARRAKDAIPFVAGTVGLLVTIAVIGQASGSSLIDYVSTRTASIFQATPTPSQTTGYPKALANREFEDGVRPWTASGGSEPSLTRSDPFRGRRSLRLTEPAGATDAYVAQTIEVRPRTKYLVTADYRPIGVRKLVTPFRGLLVWDMEGGKFVNAEIARRPGWRRIAVEIRTSPATHVLQVRLYAQRPAVEWDAVSVAAHPSRAKPPVGTVVAPLQRVVPTALPGSSLTDMAGVESNSIRVEQAKVLLRHIEHSPLVGYGFGTIAPDYPYGHIYSYELSYLDIAYKTGIVGLLLFLSFPLRLLVDAVRVRLRRLRPADGVVPYDAALVVAMIGAVLLTAVGNPVIEASYGVLPIVTSLAWLDGDVRSSSRKVLSRPLPRGAALAGLCLAALAIGAAVLHTVVSGSKRTGAPVVSGPKRSVVSPYKALPLAKSGIVETLRLPRVLAAGATPVAVTNGDLPDFNQPLQVVQLLSDGRLVVHTMRFDSIPLRRPANGGGPVLPDTTVQGRPNLGPPGKTWFDVTRFGSRNALVVARQLRSGHLRVTVLALRQGLPRLRVAVVPTPPPTGPRTVAVATWNPPVPDLFVIDRGLGRRKPAAVRIYSGESAFHKPILTHELPVLEPAPERWVWDVARIQGGRRPDIILVKRRGDSGDSEVHVLAANTFFGTFLQHLAIPAQTIPSRDQIAIGARLGQAAAYIVRFAGRTPTLSLMALPDKTNVRR